MIACWWSSFPAWMQRKSKDCLLLHHGVSLLWECNNGLRIEFVTWNVCREATLGHLGWLRIWLIDFDVLQICCSGEEVRSSTFSMTNAGEWDGFRNIDMDKEVLSCSLHVNQAYLLLYLKNGLNFDISSSVLYIEINWNHRLSTCLSDCKWSID